MKTILSFSLMMLFLCSCLKQELKQYSAEQFYKNQNITGGSLSTDESKVLISSNESGIFNLYVIFVTDGSKHQVTNSTLESYFADGYVPGTSKMVYEADKGGNEINHLYLLNEDGNTKELTPGIKEKAFFGGWSKDKKSMYYLSTLRDPRFFDMYKMKIGEWMPEMIYQNNEGIDVSGISADENYLALQKSITSSENQLFLFNRSTMKMTEISDTSNRGTYYSSGFSNDGRFLYYITDAGKEFAYLAQFEIANGNKKVLFETNWDVAGSYLSENEKYRVITINEDAKNTLLIKDNSSWENIDFPQIPDGDILSVTISDSEKKMVLTVGTSRAPRNLYVYDLESKDLKKITETLNPEINPDDLVAAEVVRFKTFDDMEIPAILYKPVRAAEKNKVPALVYVHGGPGGQTRTGFNAMIQCLVNHGYAVLGVNNRGSSGYGKTFYKMDDRNHGDKDLKDCVWGKKWLQQQEYIDSGRIGIIGGSYGGYMTMAAMSFAPEEFNVGVNFFGVTNWIRTLKSIPPDWESNRKALYAELGDPYSADSVRLYQISPLFHADQIKRPVLVLQGANDPRVLQVESDEIVSAIKKNNVPVEYIIFPDEGHGFVKKENEIKGTVHILEFLDKYLKGEV
ncbi:MAG: prolyl oligopeptidase family serine peptidase [Bacteroidales bacterium]